MRMLMRWRRKKDEENKTFFRKKKTKKKTVARYIDYGEFRFFITWIWLGSLYFEGFGGCVKGAEMMRATNDDSMKWREKHLQDIIKPHSRSCLLIYFLYSIRLYVHRVREWNEHNNHKFFLQTYTSQLFLMFWWCFSGFSHNEMMKSCVEFESFWVHMQLVLNMFKVYISAFSGRATS